MPIPGFRAKLKTENCHDANIVVIGGAEGGRNDNLWHRRRAGEDNVGIMTTRGFERM